MSDVSPLLALTLGDPHGVGPEVIAKAAAARTAYRFLVIGSCSVLREAARRYAPGISVCPVTKPEEVAAPGTLHVLDSILPAIQMSEIDKSHAGKRWGQQIAGWINQAADLALSGQVDAVVTAPIAKTAFKSAGIEFPGHTELLAARSQTSDFAMMLSCTRLRVVLATIHIPLRRITEELNAGQLERIIRLTCMELPRWFGRERKYSVAVAGLNPHAGEDGMLGTEEIEWIGPLIGKLAKEAMPVSGPYSPDTVFHRAALGEFDVVVALYHDQGLIPVKVLGFDEGVNSTLGLPFVRTSPDHGTAFDIAWQGTANASSMIHAMDLAAQASLCRRG